MAEETASQVGVLFVCFLCVYGSWGAELLPFFRLRKTIQIYQSNGSVNIADSSPVDGMAMGESKVESHGNPNYRGNVASQGSHTRYDVIDFIGKNL